ncbi:MAG: RluA family pseudouridine synthase [Prevotella sp.]|nr:RluA family pseudouridine synthase [Prevotella sp.]MDD7272630.1 RluA family pseudouridine synthase [Prevotellaceae bacterium]MDY3935929.1 RluA family pseudouridine synthase [Prevotella sp.]MDY4217432.1 RluA family pseudouridine synthase [Prevotella sp.]
MSKQKTKQRKEEYADYRVQTAAPLLEWLLANVKQSKSKIKATLQNRGVKVNQRLVTQYDFQLRSGDKVSVSTSKRNDKFQSSFVKLVYEDKFLVVVEKMPGVLSMPHGRHTPNVKTILDNYFLKTRQKCTAHVVHRLDRDTSGLMVYAKDMQTEQILERNWQSIVYERRYISVLSGLVSDDEGTIANWLKDTKSLHTYSSPFDNGGKYAVSHFRVLKRSDRHSLVEFQLETGRKNQIRVHAADMGHPVCGDIKYGTGDDPLHRLCLHAYVLCFYHPITHQPMEFDTPYPKGFQLV